MKPLSLSRSVSRSLSLSLSLSQRIGKQCHPVVTSMFACRTVHRNCRVGRYSSTKCEHVCSDVLWWSLVSRPDVWQRYQLVGQGQTHTQTLKRRTHADHLETAERLCPVLQERVTAMSRLSVCTAIVLTIFLLSEILVLRQR